MEAETTVRRSSRRRKKPLPLSDCTNTINSLNPSQSSSTSTNYSSSVFTRKPSKPIFLSSALQNLPNKPTTNNKPYASRNDNNGSNVTAVSVPYASTPSPPPKSCSLAGVANREYSEPYSVYSRRQSVDKGKGKDKALGSIHHQPLKWFSVTGTASPEVSEPCSIYGQRQSVDKRKNKGKEIAVPMSCFPTVKSQFTGDKENEDGVINQSKSCTVPCKKKKRQKPPEKVVEEHALPQDFIEQQRAYFAEIDAFELSEEEVASSNELD